MFTDPKWDLPADIMIIHQALWIYTSQRTFAFFAEQVSSQSPKDSYLSQKEVGVLDNYVMMLLTSAIFFLFAYLVTVWNPGAEQSALSRIVLTVAGISYLAMVGVIVWDPKASLFIIRYADWLVTVPIMTWQLVKLMGVKPSASYVASVVSAFIMLALGLAGEMGVWHRTWLGVFSTVFFFYIFISLADHVNRINAKIFIGQAVIWSFYGIAYFTPAKEGVIAFCCADIAAKVSLAVAANRKPGVIDVA